MGGLGSLVSLGGFFGWFSNVLGGLGGFLGGLVGLGGFLGGLAFYQCPCRADTASFHPL